MPENVKLDSKDRKILSILTFNSRTSSSTIGKLTKISREVVDYRIKKMVKSGVIIRNKILIDPDPLGLFLYQINLKFQNCSSEEEAEIISWITDGENIHWVAKTTPEWDYVIEFYVSGAKEFMNKLYRIVELAGENIRDYDFNLEVYNEHMGYRFLAPNFKLDQKFFCRDRKSFQPDFAKPRKKFKYDKIDMKILDILEENSRIPLIKIAKKLVLDAKTVRTRISRLVRGGVIIKFICVVNNQKIGYTWNRVLLKFKNTSLARLSTIREFLRGNKNIIWVVQHISSGDTLKFSVMTDNNESFTQILDELWTKFKDVILNLKVINTVKRLSLIHISEPTRPY